METYQCQGQCSIFLVVSEHRDYIHQENWHQGSIQYIHTLKIRENSSKIRQSWNRGINKCFRGGGLITSGPVAWAGINKGFWTECFRQGFLSYKTACTIPISGTLLCNFSTYLLKSHSSFKIQIKSQLLSEATPNHHLKIFLLQVSGVFYFYPYLHPHFTLCPYHTLMSSSLLILWKH